MDTSRRRTLIIAGVIAASTVATVVVVAGGDKVTGSGRDGLGGGEDMIEPKLADTKLLWRC